MNSIVTRVVKYVLIVAKSVLARNTICNVLCKIELAVVLNDLVADQGFVAG